MKDLTPEQRARLNRPVHETDISLASFRFWIDLIRLVVTFWWMLPGIIAGTVIDILEHHGSPKIRQAIKRRQSG